MPLPPEIKIQGKGSERNITLEVYKICPVLAAMLADPELSESVLTGFAMQIGDEAYCHEVAELCPRADDFGQFDRESDIAEMSLELDDTMVPTEVIFKCTGGCPNIKDSKGQRIRGRKRGLEKHYRIPKKNR